MRRNDIVTRFRGAWNGQGAGFVDWRGDRFALFFGFLVGGI
jgi:hypothetical protein